ncbi:MAG: arginine deiminase-related protein [Pseudomonadota bacterium]
MLTESPSEFLDCALKAPVDYSAATAAAAFLVADPNFSVATETADDNQYLDLDEPARSEEAWLQQCKLAQTLRDLGLPTVSFSPLAGAGDSVFPNNAFATNQRRLITGAMHYPGRQRETTHPGIRQFFCQTLGYELVELDRAQCTAELTGSLIIDHARRVGFCGLSERADAAGAAVMHEAFGLRATFLFALEPQEYHTNVVLSVLAGRGAIAYAPEASQQSLREVLDALYGAQVHYLTEAEKNHFAANCLAVTSGDVVMSKRAAEALSEASAAWFRQADFTVTGVDVSELERAGGSVRCMIGEIF